MINKNSQSLADLSVDELIQGFTNHNISPVDVAKDCLNRIDTYNEDLNAFCFIDREGALQSAKESEKRWLSKKPVSPIDGIPTSTKDTTQVKGWISTAGSAVFGMKKPALEDSSAVARLKEAGVVLLGLTNSPEVGWKGVTDSPLHGITRNPWNSDLTPGGSSGGAAVAAALGMGCLHVGTDAGGSIRIPASFTGVFGHKPSFGRVPNLPPSAFSTLSHVGPITRTVKDAAHMLTAMSKPDIRDWYSLPYQEQDYASILSKDISDLKIAFSLNMSGNAIVNDEVATQIRESIKVFQELGATVIEQDFDFSNCEQIFDEYWHAGVTWRLKDLNNEQLEMLDPGLLDLFNQSRKHSLFNNIEANQQRIELGIRANTFYQKYDLLITPTLPITAFTAGQNTPDNSSFDAWSEWAAFCYPINLTRQPACSIPCGFDKKGLPIGLQIIGRQFDDVTVLRAAAAFESISPAIMPRDKQKP